MAYLAFAIVNLKSFPLLSRGVHAQHLLKMQQAFLFRSCSVAADLRELAVWVFRREVATRWAWTKALAALTVPVESYGTEVPTLLWGGTAGRQGGAPCTSSPTSFWMLGALPCLLSLLVLVAKPKELEFASGLFLTSQGRGRMGFICGCLFPGHRHSAVVQVVVCLCFLREKCLIISSENTSYYLSSE